MDVATHRIQLWPSLLTTALRAEAIAGTTAVVCTTMVYRGAPNLSGRRERHPLTYRGPTAPGIPLRFDATDGREPGEQHVCAGPGGVRPGTLDRS